MAPDDRDGVGMRGLFSANLHMMIADANQPTPRTLQAMEDARILLLRGESGAGKTVAIAQEAERLHAAGKPVEMADLTDGLCDLAALLEKEGRRQDLTIFVDGLDIGLTRDNRLDIVLRRAMPGLANCPGARLRFALRSGFAAELLIACLEDHFGDDFEQLTIAPLRTEDVRIAAKAEGIDPVAFVGAIEGLRLAPLAARPPALRMLLGLWKKDGHLPKRRQDLYRQGCEVLLREANPDRLNAGGGDVSEYAGSLALFERFEIAERLAALMTFGDHDHLDLGADPGGAGLHVDKVTGGMQLAAGGNVRVTRGALREVVGSALFRPAGRDGFAFAHPSFMRYLAASFVAARSIPPAQGLPLLSASDGRIGANRIEVASWLGVLDPAYFDHLASADPQVLLRTGIPAASGAQRLQLATSLLARSDGGDLDLSELSETGDLVLLVSPGLGALLAGILTDKAEPLARRMFAGQVAQDTGCVPAAACAVVALDEDEPLDLRSAAISALAQNHTDAEHAILVLSAANAPNEDLHLVALGVAMRTLLSPADVIRCLKPGKEDMAQTFLCLRLLRDIVPADLPEALDAVVAIAIHGDEKQRYASQLMVGQALVRLAFGHLDDGRIRDALATFIATLPTRDPWLRWSFPLDKHGLPSAVTLEQRRALVSAVVTRAPGSAAAARNLLEACFLLRSEDLPWIVTEARSALGGPDAALWSTLAAEVARGFGGAFYGHLRVEGASDSEIDQFARAALPLPADYERWAPPVWWDSTAETNADEREDEARGEDDEEEEEEPILTALANWKLLTLQTEAGGRAAAPSVDPGTLLALFERADRRLVCDSRDLLRVIRESLDRLQRRLKGRDPLVRALWNEGSAPFPKDENFLSDFIVDHLRGDLIDSGVVADREAQIRPRLRDTAGERTDIQVQAFTNRGSGASGRPVASLTIEVKGCWNRDLYTAMEIQLVGRYLATTSENVGLYLVGWYICPAWKDGRVADRATTSGDTLAALRGKVDLQARSLSGGVRHIEGAVIDASLT